MLRREFLASASLLAISGSMLSQALGKQPAAVRKVAFLAGVSKYQKDGFENLSYCERDVEELSRELRKHGFEVSTLGRRRIGSWPRWQTVWPDSDPGTRCRSLPDALSVPSVTLWLIRLL